LQNKRGKKEGNLWKKMVDILCNVLPTVVECAHDPMKRHISYAFKFKRYVNNLKEGMKDLKGE